jgi:hypothetical protein
MPAFIYYHVIILCPSIMGSDVYLQILRCGYVVIVRDLTGLNVAQLNLTTTKPITINTHINKIRKLERQICVENVDDCVTLQNFGIKGRRGGSLRRHGARVVGRFKF